MNDDDDEYGDDSPVWRALLEKLLALPQVKNRQIRSIELRETEGYIGWWEPDFDHEGVRDGCSKDGARITWSAS